MRPFTKKIACLTFAVCSLTGEPRAQAVDQDVPWQIIQDWSIYQSRVYKGCIATARYQDGTQLRLGYDGIVRGYFVNLSNPRWTGYENLKNYELFFVMDGSRSFRGYFHMIERDRFPTFETGGVNLGFLEGIAAANGVIVRLNDFQIASMSLSGSRRALSSMVDCERARQSR